MADRSVEEIGALCRAAQFCHHFAAGKLTMWKGSPSVLICVEPMMTMSLSIVDGETEVHRRVFRVDVVGPITRMAMALHLGLTPTEAASIALTADAAEADLLARANAALEAMEKPDGVTARQMGFTIPPSDPRWIESQRAAEPWRARTPRKAAPRG